MFVIFGIGYNTNKEHQLQSSSFCNNCNNESRWMVSKATRWFTLFFIPVFPYKTEYITYCPICKSGFKITKEEFERKNV